MKLDDFIKLTTKFEEDKEIWLKNETFNKIVESAEKVRLNQEGYLELCYKSIMWEVSLDSILSSNSGILYARMLEISEYEMFTNIKKNVIYYCPQKALGEVIL